MEESSGVPNVFPTLRAEGLDTSDNWLGLADASERRKRQNRLHQRAWRRKRNAARAADTPAVLPPPHLWNGQGKLVLRTRDVNDVAGSNEDQRPSQTQPDGDRGLSVCAASRSGSTPARQLLIPPMVPKFDPRGPKYMFLPTKFTFPLSPDHHLITLIQYNVKRALLVNMAIVGTLHAIHPEQQGVYSLPPLPIQPPASVPSFLEPTELQKSSRSVNPLICSVPSPSMRDNLIINAGNYDIDAMGAEIYGGLFEGFSDTENHGVMVWGEPWSPHSWEISEGFAKRWGFLLKGCTDLIEASNQWRSSRGEPRLVVEL